MLVIIHFLTINKYIYCSESKEDRETIISRVPHSYKIRPLCEAELQKLKRQIYIPLLILLHNPVYTQPNMPDVFYPLKFNVYNDFLQIQKLMKHCIFLNTKAKIEKQNKALFRLKSKLQSVYGPYGIQVVSCRFRLDTCKSNKIFLTQIINTYAYLNRTYVLPPTDEVHSLMKEIQINIAMEEPRADIYIEMIIKEPYVVPEQTMHFVLFPLVHMFIVDPAIQKANSHP